MKKAIYVFTTATLIFLGIVAGIFIGRNTAGTWLTLEPSSTVNSAPSNTAQPNNEIGKININTADLNELIILPGIGNAKAAKIIEFREAYGRFTCIEDLVLVDGFQYATVEQLRPYVTVGG